MDNDLIDTTSTFLEEELQEISIDEDKTTITTNNKNNKRRKNKDSVYTDINLRPNEKNPYVFNYMSIGIIRSIFPDVRGTPRQGFLMPESRACVVLHNDIPGDILIGLEEFEFVWIFFHFHKNKPIKLSEQQKARAEKLSQQSNIPIRTPFHAKVRPPKITHTEEAHNFQKKEKIGAFACRTPHRPNPMGLSVAKLVKVSSQDRKVWVSGLDLVDGTPVLDIKPYVPVYDSIPNASVPAWVDTSLSRVDQNVNIADDVYDKIIQEKLKRPDLFAHFQNDEEIFSAITKMLALDINSGSTQAREKKSGRDEGNRIFRVSMSNMDFSCDQHDEGIRVVGVDFRIRDENTDKDPSKGQKKYTNKDNDHDNNTEERKANEII